MVKVAKCVTYNKVIIICFLFLKGVDSPLAHALSLTQSFSVKFSHLTGGM